MALRLEYGFDEASGSFLESSGGASGTLSAGGSRVTGHTGSAIQTTSGSNSAGIVVGSPIVASSTWTGFTIMCWIKRGTADGDFMAGFAGGSNDSFGLKLASSGNNFGGWFQTNSAFYDNNAAHSVTSGTWLHVALTWSSAGTARLFVNGVQIHSASVAGSTAEGNFTSIEIGGVNWGGSPLVPVDDLRVFDSAEDAASITSWMNTPVSSAGPVMQDLILPARTFASAGRW